ncbi:DNA-binding transcription factor yap1 [Trapelia coarctata]|nr:DNA-binding transcription factor yap1 [Trapelia coarctata]
MTNSAQDDGVFSSHLYLSPQEQNLLLTALNSNKPTQPANDRSYPQVATNGSKPSGSRSNSNPQHPAQPGRKSLDNSDFYASPLQKAPGSALLRNLSFEDSPYLHFEHDEGNFDWDINGDQLIGSLPGTSVDDEDGDLHDKRKASDDDGEEIDGGGKRREGEDKVGKKPGRKPLTSEPTSKRKAQNRAAQRAFRERKERHLKELETKVEELEKASESTNHENGLLRAQVERLQTELKEYRNRVSLNSNGVSRTPPQPTGQFMGAKANWDVNNNFQFEFPLFGPAQTARIGTNGAITKPNPVRRDTNGSPTANTPGVVRENSLATSTSSPKSFSGGPRTSSQPRPGGLTREEMSDLSNFFSPSVLQSASRNNSTDFLSYSSGSQRKQSSSADDARRSAGANGGSLNYNTASPSDSSVSHNGFNSSCVTTPETFSDMLDHTKPCDGSKPVPSEGEKTFCEIFQTACGNKENPIPPMMSQSNETSAPSTAAKAPGSDLHSFDWLASQNGGAFDPVLFANYRDPQESIMNGGFGDFFNDAFPSLDSITSPPITTLETNLPRKRDLLQEIETQAEKEPEVVPGEGPKQFLTCNMLWDRVQRSEKVQSGEADMDDLCTQLKSKAKCSGSGAVIDQKDVDAILGPAPKEHEDFLQIFT